MDRAEQINRSREAIEAELAKGHDPDPQLVAREFLRVGAGVALDLARIAAALERIAHHLENE